MRRRAFRLLSVVVLAGGAAAIGLPAVTTGAQAVSIFTAVGSASTYDVVYLQDSVPITQGAQVSGSSVDSRLDSSGNGCSFASFPYPGEGIATLPDTASSLAPPPLGENTPGYPTYIKTCTGQAPATFGQEGANFLRSANTETRSEGLAVAGSAPGPATFASSVTKVERDGSVSVRSEARSDGVVVAGAVEVGGVRTLATALRSAGGAIALSSSMSIAELVVAGQTFGFKNGQFFLAGTGTPVPANDVFAALAASGVKGSFQKERRFGGGKVVSPTFTLEVPLPVGSLPSQTDAALILQFGLSAAEILGEVFEEPVDPGVAPPPVEPPVTDPGTPPPPAPADGSGTAGPPPIDPGTTQPDVAQPPATTPGDGAGTPGAIRPAATTSPDSFDIYPVLVAAALLALAATQAVRLLGVRFAWVS